MVSDPSGSISVPKHALRDMLAESATFRAEVKAADAAAAKEFIHLGFYGLTATNVGPFAVVGSEDDSPSWELIADGASNVLFPHGGLAIYLRAPNGSESTDEAITLFENFMGTTIDELAASAGEGGNLNCGRIYVAQQAQRTDPDQDNQRDTPFWDGIIGVDWGVSV